MSCRRLEDEEMLADLGDTLHEHVEECSDCLANLQHYRAIADMVATGGQAHELPLGWKDRAMAKVAPMQAQSDGDAPQWSLLVQYDDSMVRFPLPRSGVVTIGSATDVELRLADPVVAPRHACVIASRGRYQLLDLNGEAGSAVNRETLVGIRDLKDHDLITIGSTRLWLEHESSNQRQASARDPDAGVYRQLLRLNGELEIEPLLMEALSLIVEVTCASAGYIELQGAASAQPMLWKTHGVPAVDVPSIRASIARDIVARELREGRTIATASVNDDPRFSPLGSVRENEIRSVLLAPIGSPPVGVIYLEGRKRRGGFSAVDRECVELLVRQLALFTRQLVRRQPGPMVDHTRGVRVKFRCEEMVGRSQALATILENASQVAPLDLTLLITGALGTGKSMLARAIANSSKRSGKPFVEVNCAAIPDALIEAELFGVAGGAHSNSKPRMASKVAAAQGGTLFLNEVSELAPGTQGKLLTLLETGQYYVLRERSPRPADLRIIAATSVNLEERVAAGRFREDLFYRLHTVSLKVPALEERRDDIPQLVEHFCVKACEQLSLPTITPSRSALAACRDAPWPGNLRQLANAVEFAVARAQFESSRTLRVEHLFPKTDVTTDHEPRTLREATRGFQRRYLQKVLEESGWSIRDAAHKLDISRAHLYNLLSTFELKRPGNDENDDEE